MSSLEEKVETKPPLAAAAQRIDVDGPDPLSSTTTLNDDVADVGGEEKGVVSDRYATSEYNKSTAAASGVEEPSSPVRKKHKPKHESSSGGKERISAEFSCSHFLPIF